MKFNAIEWLRERSKLNIQEIEIDGIPFEIMALCDDDIEYAKQIEDYNELLDFAAENGISFDRKRVADDEGLFKDLDIMWQMFHDDDPEKDPSIRARLGESVCEISGLSEHANELLKASQPTVIDGDNLPDLEQTLGEVTQEQLDADNARYAQGA